MAGDRRSNLVGGFGGGPSGPRCAFGLKSWAWTWGVWTHAAIMLWNLLAALGPARLAERWVTLAVSGLILFYLTTPAIKRAFGKV